MFKNCRKEDFRIVALELGETLAEKVTIVELTEIIKESKYFKEDVKFVKELVQYTIEDCKKAEEDSKKAEEDRKRAEEDRKRVEEDRKKEAENRLREKELELELARLNVRVNSDNGRTGESCNTLDALVKSVRILTVKVPNRPEVKAILDSGSTSNFLTRSLCELIGLKKYKTNVSVSGLNKTVIPIDSRVSVSISNKEGSYIKTLDFFLVPTITEDLVPTTKIDFNLNNIPNLKLADKNFNIPERVQMLLGAEVFYELMLTGQFKEGSNVIFQNTVFGLVVSGSTSSDAKGKEHCGFIQAADNVELSIKKFWEIENVEIDSIKTGELDICEDHFKNTHSRDDQGRYKGGDAIKRRSFMSW
ncbi:integrase catalytic domain-containing protein [Trichonephila clavipes]|nr:integrase catalytic domain-containing protein [Trichonephila clavipes]